LTKKIISGRRRRRGQDLERKKRGERINWNEPVRKGYYLKGDPLGKSIKNRALGPGSSNCKK